MAEFELNLSKDGWETNHCIGYGTAFRTEKTESIRAADFDISIDSPERISEYNGFFSVIHNEDGQVFAAVDHLQTCPLYYAVDDEVFYISDDVHWIHSEISSDETKDHRLEYLLFGYTLGSHTRSAEVKQLRGGEYLITDVSGESPSIKTERYFQYPSNLDATPEYKNKTQSKLLDRLDDIHRSCFNRLEALADGRPLAVSLSGGYDSRLILLMLVRMDYGNVYTFTYGPSDAKEVEQAKNIADTLNVSWIHIPYEHEQWYNWYRSTIRTELDRYLGELATVPAVDDALAVQKLKEDELLPSDAIIITGDHVSGSSRHIPHSFLSQNSIDRKLLTQTLLDLHIRWDSRCLLEDSVEKRIKNRVEKISSIKSSMRVEEAARRFERFGWEERQSKFIPRNEIYEFYDYDWWLPLWDREYVEFWSNVPVEYRQGKELHKKYIVSLMAEVTHVTEQEAKSTFESGWSPVSKVDRTLDWLDKSIRQYPRLDRVFRPLYFNIARTPPEYSSDPKFGIMSENFFESLPTGEYYIHGYRILDSLGYISIEDEKINQFPKEVTLPKW